MRQKVFEVVDRMTCIKVLVTELLAESDDDLVVRRYLKESGFSQSRDNTQYFMTLLSHRAGETKYTPYGWDDQYTLGNAHKFISDNFDTLLSGWTIDCEYIRGEKDKVKLPEFIMLSPSSTLSFKFNNNNYHYDDLEKLLIDNSLGFIINESLGIMGGITLYKSELLNLSGDKVYEILKYFNLLIA